MANILDKVKTIVLVMFENRSFDHILGHLSYENINPLVDGLEKPINQYVNYFKGDVYTSYNLPNDTMLPFDLPHEYDAVATQLAKSDVTRKYTMLGFVEAYAKDTGINPNPQTEPMGFFNSAQVPISSFLARTFCTCDRWFASLPTSTQPNRTIAFTGDSGIYNTSTQLIQINDSIFDWMDRAGVRWRVYHDGLSFFSFYPKLWHYVLGDNFRDYEYLYRDLLNENPDTAPQVIIVEPSYQDAPHIGPDHPNDNHAPLAIGWGEDFLRRTYEAVIANSDRWANTVMAVYYDEHGGFYDHVPPPSIPYTITGNSPYQFSSLGPRIPGIIISPFVEQGSRCHSIFDHTSVLQFLAEKFTPGVPYSPSVDGRSKQLPGIASISDALANEDIWIPPLPPAQPINVTSALGDNISAKPTHAMAQSFEMAALQLIANNSDAVNAKYPDLLQWKDVISKART
jgi:phospholipase C